MNIGINAQLATANRAGIGNYIYHLTNAISRLDHSNTYSLFVNQECCVTQGEAGNIRQVPASFIRNKSWARILWEQLILPHVLVQAGVDIMHFPDYALPILYRTRPWIITVHDLAFKLYPETFSRGKRITKLLLIEPSLKKAHKVIAVSENTKADLIKLYNVPPEKIEVIYNGVDLEVFKPLDSADVGATLRRKYKIEPGYLLYIGTLEPRKNIISLIKAYKKMKEELEIHKKLVITGSKGWLYQNIFTTVTELGMSEDVIFTGYIPNEDLAMFYNGASVFVYPTLYEGFGLPPLEAMACGTPVVSSSVSSIPEVVGDAGILIDPLDIDALAQAVYEILTNDDLAAGLISRGIQQARQFTWEESARKTIAVYKEVYEQGMRR